MLQQLVHKMNGDCRGYVGGYTEYLGHFGDL